MTNRFEIASKITGRLKSGSATLFDKLTGHLNHRISRLEADTFREKVARENGKAIVDRKLKLHIKSVCRQKFGSAGYWHWPALYAEMRGEYYENWLPVDFYRFTLLPRWNSLAELSLYKTFDHKLFGDFAVKPAIICIGGRYYKSDFEPLREIEVKTYLKGVCDEVIVKPDAGRSGEGTGFYKTDQIEAEELIKIKNFVVQPVIKQHPELDRLSNSSVNSIRITTFMDHASEVRLLFANQKFGMGGNRVDNLGSGGMFLRLGNDGEAVTDAMGDYGSKIMEKHPIHGFRFRGFVVPAYKKALEECIRAHKSFPYIRVIGWDVAIDEEGMPKLLEWNARRPGIWVDEALFGPLWNDNEIFS